MGYLHIENLYRAPEFLACGDTEVYCLEKIHGTSAHISYCVGESPELKFFSGGEKYENFVNLFDEADLRFLLGVTCLELGVKALTIYGEAYGGRQQRMSDTYGPNLKFVAFDVKVVGASGRAYWLNVSEAHSVVSALGLEFVDYAKVPLVLAALDAERDRPSTQSIRNGMGSDKIREGVVIRPLVEREDRRGNRVIYKHKRAEFRETKKPRDVTVDASKVEVLRNAAAIAEEWVVAERLNHVLDHMKSDMGLEAFDMSHTADVCRRMLEDVKRESLGEVEWTREAERAVGRECARRFKEMLKLQNSQALVGV